MTHRLPGLPPARHPGLRAPRRAAFLYNAITFGFGSILVRFFDVPNGVTGYYFAVITLGDFLGPLFRGRLFDTWGRRPMIAGTCALSGPLLFGTAVLFDAGVLDASP